MSRGVLIHDLPEQERPRERLAALGADAIPNAELIAILLRTGTKGVSAIHVAQELLARFKTLENLAKASLEDLRKTCATFYDEHVPESSIEILGHSVGGITYRHYAHRGSGTL